MARVMLVEDDENVGVSLKKHLEDEGYSVSLAPNLKSARSLKDGDFSLVILDWMLPDGQGIDFLKEMRADYPQIPIIMLTAKTELIDKVLGLESGANDYITKPFEPRELVARIRVQLRENKNNVEKEIKLIEVHTLKIDLEKRDVTFNEKILELTKMEYDLLRLLAESPGRVFSREEILNKVWGFENYPSTRTVDTHVLQLRQKISEDIIETMRGIGYRLKPL